MAGLWLAVTMMPYCSPMFLTVNMICGVGQLRLTKATRTPSPAITSQNQMQASRLRKRRSYPAQMPLSAQPSRTMRRARAAATR